MVRFAAAHHPGLPPDRGPRGGRGPLVADACLGPSSGPRSTSPGEFRLADVLGAVRRCPGDVSVADCRVLLELEVDGKGQPSAVPPLRITIPTGRLYPGERDVKSFGDAAAPTPGDAQMATASKLLTFLIGNQEKSAKIQQRFDFCCQMLCAVQTADPRPTSHYRGKKWCKTGLEDGQRE
ncbi:uncharacterized protein LOC129591726 [Paramacrobiotus metropolitanus]|uniref:uncharacterized protein LOC129591726 n=1 Tax=Paramacrobiotus metropolitanus TaxID=2943436 RepID=UPI002445FDB3|nr:uncharacterized protein LOC129591726 [Paramacrobiotus metropolitanus]XP_055343478.1 uncharacterized protein LOC129591726 [Paramacrobiotus metropolitanus]